MPYKLRKAPKRELYWVVTTETGKKHSKEPIPKDKAKAQLRVLEAALEGSGKVNQAHIKKLKREFQRIQRKADKIEDAMYNYSESSGIPVDKLLKDKGGQMYLKLREEQARIYMDIQKWKDAESLEDYKTIPEEDEGSGKRGGIASNFLDELFKKHSKTTIQIKDLIAIWKDVVPLITKEQKQLLLKLNPDIYEIIEEGLRELNNAEELFLKERSWGKYETYKNYSYEFDRINELIVQILFKLQDSIDAAYNERVAFPPQQVRRGKGNDEKYNLIVKLIKQASKLAVKSHTHGLTKQIYEQHDALITNIKNEIEQFLARPESSEIHKKELRGFLHGVIPMLLKKTTLPEASKEVLGFGKVRRGKGDEGSDEEMKALMRPAPVLPPAPVRRFQLHGLFEPKPIRRRKMVQKRAISTVQGAIPVSAPKRQRTGLGRKGGIILKQFANKLVREGYITSDDAESLKTNPTKRVVPNINVDTNEGKEKIFKFMTECIEQGIYGDDYDRQVTMEFEGRTVNAFETLIYYMELISAERSKISTSCMSAFCKGKISKKQFYSLPAWHSFNVLLSDILINLVPAPEQKQESPPSTPKPTRKPAPPKSVRTTPPSGYVPAPASAPVPKSASITTAKKIENFRDLFKQIYIGDLKGTQIIIQPNYLKEVDQLIVKTLGSEILPKLQATKVYNDLKKLVETTINTPTSFEQFRAIVKQHRPEEYTKIKKSFGIGQDLEQQGIKYIELYEDELITEYEKIVRSAV
jgi:hypothetical protein